ncbi:MAG TPA: ferritin-like domain-containing protein [Thermoleophilaceae bacterium]|nr:ferritin-like domain-containing protein [Thermoleophilaceae bacterium]
MAPKPVIDFDLDRYLRASEKLDLSELSWEDIPKHPLADGDVMSMHYMLDIETHTVIYLRDLLATRAANDPQITAFLACWAYEELWHGEAFSDFLRAYGIEVPAEPKFPDGSTPMPTRAKRTHGLRGDLGVGQQLHLVPTMVGSALFRDFIGLHMTWGAINELTTLTGYHALIRRSEHPVLEQMLRRVIQDERRHFAFYRAQGRARLEAAPRRTRRLVRRVFENFWTPVGAGVKSAEEVDSLLLYLFGYDQRGREMLREIDETVSEIPGLEGLRLLERELDRAQERAAARPGWAGVVPAPPVDPQLRGAASEAWRPVPSA